VAAHARGAGHLSSPALALLLAGPAAGALAARRTPRPAVAWLTLATVGVLLILVPPGAVLGAPGAELHLSAFGRGALAVALIGLAALAAVDGGPAVPVAAWAAVTIVLLGASPLPLVAALAAVALVLPDAARRYRAALVVGGVLLCGVAAVSRRPVDRLPALGVTAGLLVLVGALPFGVGLLQWVEDGPRAPARATLAAGCAAALALLVEFAATMQPAPAAGEVQTAFAVFGVVTLLAGSGLCLLAPGLRALAARGAVADVGLALVGLATPSGARAAALVLISLVLTRLALAILDVAPARSGLRLAAGWLATLGAAGLPPTIGFAARVLVLLGAFRVNPVLAGAVVAGTLLQLAAPLRLALGPGGFLPDRPGAAGGPAPGGRDLVAAAAATGLGLLSLAAGLAPMQAAALFGLG